MRLATMLPLVVVVGFLGCSEGTTEPEPNEADAALFQASANSVGISAQQSPVSIQDILAFFDASVEARTLDGRGQRPQSKKARLRVFRFHLLAASTPIEAGRDGLACHRLEHAYLRSDGQTPPPDFLVGDATAELNTMILQLIADMGCELPG